MKRRTLLTFSVAWHADFSSGPGVGPKIISPLCFIVFLSMCEYYITTSNGIPLFETHNTPPTPPLQTPTPTQTPTQQASITTSYSDTVTFYTGPGGCSITYYDELQQPIPLITGASLSQIQQVNSNGMNFVNAPLQMLTQQAPSSNQNQSSIANTTSDNSNDQNNATQVITTTTITTSTSQNNFTTVNTTASISNDLNNTNNTTPTVTTTSISQQQQPASIGLDCQNITAEQLHDRFNRIKASGLKVISLVVKDSNLTTLGNLPQGIHELRKLIISNTSIDLEVLREGSESLDQLQTLDITNEKISNIPQNFFQEMSSLRELRLENDEIASLDSDAFHNLDDSLETLDLKRNRFNRFPMAVKNLAQLAKLDLTDNDIVIDTQENDLPEKLEPLLNLHELNLNTINCTCEFSSSPFYEWIHKAHLSGVRCFAPEKLKHREVIVFQRDEFCTSGSAAASPVKMQLNDNTIIVLFVCLVASTIHLIRQALSLVALLLF